VATESVPLPDPAARRARLTVGAVRLTVLVVTTLLATADPRPLRALPWVLAAVVAGALALMQRESTRAWRLVIAIEIGIAAVGVGYTGGPRSALLPYLVAPLFALGFRSGPRTVLIMGGGLALAGIMSGLRLPGARVRDVAISAVEWTVLSVSFGLVASWARTLLESADPAARYQEAYRLLTELRGVTRRLPGTLDPVSAAEALLDQCAEVVPFDRAAVLVTSTSDRLTPVVVRGADRLDLDIGVSGSGPVATSFRSGLVVREPDRRVRSGMASLLVVPLPGDDTRHGVVVLEAAAANQFPVSALPRLGRAVAAGATRLEAARVFDDVRSLATVEERQRVAREIHDGIAQELVYVGYELDNLAAELRKNATREREAVVRVRQHVTRIIGELRLSIFNLRSGPETTTGLGAALGEYVRSVAGAAGIDVHLSLSEGRERLAPDVEAELLRIAQEAVSNARKHAAAQNLWVTVTVAPPRAVLRVEDDGTGIASNARAGFGLDIMRERAARLGARLAVSPRQPHGTCVEVELGG
jgi:signal transduction histidine kinase